MLFNILLVLLVTCFTTAIIPTTMLAKENKYDVADVTIENAAHVEKENDIDDEEFPSVSEDEEGDEGDELGNVSFDPAAEHPDLTFNFDEFDEDGNDKD